MRANKYGLYNGSEYAAGTIKAIEKLKTRLHGRPAGSGLSRDRNEVCAKVNTFILPVHTSASQRNCFFNFSLIIILNCLNNMLYFLQIKGGIINGVSIAFYLAVISIDKKSRQKKRERE